MSIAEMLESIIRTEEEGALELTTDNRIRSIPFKGLVDVARRLIGQTNETEIISKNLANSWKENERVAY